jgi:glutamate-1-semialdehyde 2,1-aminomutase
VYQASTFAGNAISVTASMSCLGALMEAKNSIYPQMSRMCDSVTAALRDEAEDLKLNCVVNSIGSMYQLFFTSDKVRDASGARKSDQAKFRKLYDYLLKDGVFIPPSQFETCFLSYSHSEDDCDRTVEAYRNALGKIRDDKV